jgi:hypothetical protein
MRSGFGPTRNTRPHPAIPDASDGGRAASRPLDSKISALRTKRSPTLTESSRGVLPAASLTRIPAPPPEASPARTTAYLTLDEPHRAKRQGAAGGQTCEIDVDRGWRLGRRRRQSWRHGGERREVSRDALAERRSVQRGQRSSPDPGLRDP